MFSVFGIPILLSSSYHELCQFFSEVVATKFYVAMEQNWEVVSKIANFNVSIIQHISDLLHFFSGIVVQFLYINMCLFPPFIFNYLYFFLNSFRNSISTGQILYV